MSTNPASNNKPAPCIVDFGTIVNKDDIKRLLNDLCHVRYFHSIDSQLQSEGQGYILEVFNEPNQSTLIANGSIYINVQSFDYLQLSQSACDETCFDLVQEHRILRLIPICVQNSEQILTRNIDAATIEAMVTDVLSARLDVQLDDDF
ncbi:hypothetical protein Sta7437_2355 [Stanieria cyanosphaera PCC 7437]|uniref:Uncharacterized protein n=1 Tax=Stanieria cyanosphaera (strain ATCC 29371 / PCC 7437) TaxID=111780 RepID=K9XUZ1_STAC7|nr:hypothetical protein [Stanieria cyanosphaera]AFZ35896.1 hypothetical protein Sta7437_2355 [Stanieria cyanosphaera PCC 7437]